MAYTLLIRVFKVLMIGELKKMNTNYSPAIGGSVGVGQYKKSFIFLNY